MSVRIDDERGEVVAHRTVFASGGSWVVSLPPEILDAAEFGPGDDVTVSREHGSGDIILRADPTGESGDDD